MFGEASNTEIDVSIMPVGDFNSKITVMLAGGTDIDVIWNMGPTNAGMYDIIEQGAFLALDDYLAEYPAVKEAIDQTTWDTQVSSDGKHYFFPNALAVFVPFPIYYREDVFEELGIAIPTTMDEFTDALRAIKAGKPDMIPFTHSSLTSEWYFQNIYAAYGYSHGWQPDPNDPTRIIPGVITDEYKEALSWLHLLRVEGLIDPDSMIAQGKRGSDTFKAGEAAVLCINWDSYLDLKTNLVKNVPTGTINILPPMKGPKGVTAAKNLTGYDRGYSINVASKDKAEDIFKFLNWAFTDGYDINRYGFEGKTYTVTPEGVKVGIPDDEREPDFVRANVEPMQFGLKSADTMPDWQARALSFQKAGLTIEEVDIMRRGFEESIANYIPDYDRFVYTPTRAAKNDGLNADYLTPAYQKVMIDPAAGIEVYEAAIEQWLANGGQQIIDEVNEAQKDKTAPVFKWEYTGPDYH
ncbi:hypothetical protein FACS1894191_1800 [Clostridia bacterium]|nr:hypothetical protein FACS1894191_1800 [Clostridia bacterium]